LSLARSKPNRPPYILAEQHSAAQALHHTAQAHAGKWSKLAHLCRTSRCWDPCLVGRPWPWHQGSASSQPSPGGLQEREGGSKGGQQVAAGEDWREEQWTGGGHHNDGARWGSTQCCTAGLGVWSVGQQARHRCLLSMWLDCCWTAGASSSYFRACSERSRASSTAAVPRAYIYRCTRPSLAPCSPLAMMTPCSPSGSSWHLLWGAAMRRAVLWMAGPAGLGGGLYEEVHEPGRTAPASLGSACEQLPQNSNKKHYCNP